MKNYGRKIIVTGAAGFIGAAVAKKLLLNGDNVIGIDNINNYYDTSLKINRIKDISENFADKNWIFFTKSIEDFDSLNQIFLKYKPDIVIHLAAQAGVRYSLEAPSTYIKSNLVGFANILELARNYAIQNFIYASSSSVYGGNKKVPFVESDNVNHPISLYASTKRSNELMAHSYSHLFDIPSTGLRFFTVYGPWGRPDMAPMIFAKSIIESNPIKIFNFGKMKRDFTYIDDICESIVRCTYKPATPNINFDSINPDPSTSNAPHRIFNIGNRNNIELLYFIELIEKFLDKKAIREFLPLQPGDVEVTYADTKKLEEWINFAPQTSIEEGVEKFIRWYLKYHD